MIAGMTVLPARLTLVAPAGARTPAAAPACVMRVPSTTMVAFSIVLPSPTISLAPSNTVTCASAGRHDPARIARTAEPAMQIAFTRRIGILPLSNEMIHFIRSFAAVGGASALVPSVLAHAMASASASPGEADSRPWCKPAARRYGGMHAALLLWRSRLRRRGDSDEEGAPSFDSDCRGRLDCRHCDPVRLAHAAEARDLPTGLDRNDMVDADRSMGQRQNVRLHGGRLRGQSRSHGPAQDRVLQLRNGCL